MIGKRVKLSSLHHHYHEVNTVDTEELKQLPNFIRISSMNGVNVLAILIMKQQNIPSRQLYPTYLIS
jgi:hypothetical protein